MQAGAHSDAETTLKRPSDGRSPPFSSSKPEVAECFLQAMASLPESGVVFAHKKAPSFLAGQRQGAKLAI